MNSYAKTTTITSTNPTANQSPSPPLIEHQLRILIPNYDDLLDNIRGQQPHSSRAGGSGMSSDRRNMMGDRRMNSSMMDRQMVSQRKAFYAVNMSTLIYLLQSHYDSSSSSHRNPDMMDNRASDGHRNNRERISPHTSNYQDGGNQGSNGSNIKSDSPSRKRRRLQRMPSQSPPTIWENNNNQAMNQIQNQSNQNNYHHHQNRRLSPRHYHNNGPQHSPPIRRQRFRDQQQQPQPPRPWDVNPTAIFQQPSPPHHTHPHHAHSQHSLMVEMNHQVPVSLPLSHEQIWTYPAPHISICKHLKSKVEPSFDMIN